MTTATLNEFAQQINQNQLSKEGQLALEEMINKLQSILQCSRLQAVQRLYALANQ